MIDKWACLVWRRRLGQPFEILVGVYGAIEGDEEAANAFMADFERHYLREGERVTIEPLIDPATRYEAAS